VFALDAVLNDSLLCERLISTRAGEYTPSLLFGWITGNTSVIP
jgi:hypothetical protein